MVPAGRLSALQLWRAALNATVDSAVCVAACYILAKSEAFAFACAARKQTELLQKGYDLTGMGRVSVMCFLHIHTHTLLHVG